MADKPVDGVASMRLMTGDVIGFRVVVASQHRPLEGTDEVDKKTQDGEEEAGNSYSSLRCFVVCFVADSFVLDINIHVPLSVSVSGKHVVIDIRNGSCLGSVL